MNDTARTAPAPAATGPANDNTALAVFTRPRLPWHPAIEERFTDLGVNRSTWKTLVEGIWPSAKSTDSIITALAYCQARRLDPFKRAVHIVPVYSTELKKMVETVWPSISELRTTAMRTGQYAGCDELEEGPMVNMTLATVSMVFPEWARLTIYRRDHRERVGKFVGPKVYWLESYAPAARDTLAPNAMWRRRPQSQLEKCAEAASLRRAFPEEIGSDYAAEEMAGHTLGYVPGMGAERPLAASAGPRQLHAGFSEPATQDPSPPEEITIDGEFVEVATAEAAPPIPANDRMGQPANDTGPFDVLGWAAKLLASLPDYAGSEVLGEDFYAHRDELREASASKCKELAIAVARRQGELIQKRDVA